MFCTRTDIDFTQLNNPLIKASFPRLLRTQPLFLPRRLGVKRISACLNNSPRRNLRRAKLSSRSPVNQIQPRVWFGHPRAPHLRAIVILPGRTWVIQPQVKVREVSRRKGHRQAPAWLGNQLSMRRMVRSTLSNLPPASKHSPKGKGLVHAVPAKNIF